jgi:membrane protease YdiL (CAAX protease family)
VYFARRFFAGTKKNYQVSANRLAIAGIVFMHPVLKTFCALALLCFSAAMVPLTERLTEAFLALGWLNGNVGRVPRDLCFLLIAGALCLITPRRCGLQTGSAERWRENRPRLALVFAVPPLLVLTVYAMFTSRPFHGAHWSIWLIESVAQELFFAGFIFARESELFGEPTSARRDWFHPALLFTTLCFAAWHWPNIRFFPKEYMLFQFLYTFLGGWWMWQMRRWTGSVLPSLANHMLVNWLATIV